MNKRVIQISLDIVVGHMCDGSTVAHQVAEELNTRGYRVIGQGFQADVTNDYIVEEFCQHEKNNMNKDTVIYNMILMLNQSFDTMDIDNQNFIDYICENANLPESEYRRILKPLLED